MPNNNSTIVHARLIGTCFLLAFVFYGVGRFLFDSVQPASRYFGAALIMLNSISVVSIGFLLQKTLLQYNGWVGSFYLQARIIEAIALVSLVLDLLPGIYFKSEIPYFVGMLSLGLGSIPMCWELFKSRLCPRWLAIWGIVGYSLFSFGFLSEFFGKHWSMYLLGFAGLWEVVFGCWLILKNGRHQKAVVLQMGKVV